MNSELMQRLRKWTNNDAVVDHPNGVAPALFGAADTGAPPAPCAEAADPQNDADALWRKRVNDMVLSRLDLAVLSNMPEMQARTEIQAAAQHVMTAESMPLSAASRQRIAKQVEDEILGLGPIEPLLADKAVSDILVNGSGQVYIERRGRLEATDVRFRDNAHLMAIIDRIVGRVGRRIDESSPMVDARLPDGSRVNAIIPPLALDGPLLSIRRFTIGRLKMEELIELGTISPVMADTFKAIVHGRLNVLISGGTGSGKTTLLNVLSGFIPVTERIITIEDSAELQMQQPHICRLETRPPNIEGRGEVTQRDLVRNALRMRPDRIVVGEVRGGEAFDMLQAMNTGHDGSLTTVHANTPRDALSRVQNMIAMAAVGLPAQTAREQIASAINVVIQTERMEDGRRRVVSVQEIQGMESGTVTMSEFFRFARRGVDKNGFVTGHYESTGLVPTFLRRLQQRGIQLAPECFANIPHKQ
jgi:pilus assembly protein CpaF